MRTWSEPVTTLLPKQGLGKGKERMNMEHADELLKTLEFVSFPELEDDSEDDWTVKKYKKTIRKERIEKEVCPWRRSLRK